MTASAPRVDLWVWRHPRAIGATGRCVGRTDLGVDRRRAKRLAGRIRALARRHGLPREIWTSPLRRAADVGRILRGWGWTHRVDADLVELDFGRWDGRHWFTISAGEVAAWEADFVHHAPGGGESQADLHARIRRFVDARAADAAPVDAGASDAPVAAARAEGGRAPRTVLAVSHAGWIATLMAGGACADPARWPAPTPTMGLRRLRA